MQRRDLLSELAAVESAASCPVAATAKGGPYPPKARPPSKKARHEPEVSQEDFEQVYITALEQHMYFQIPKMQNLLDVRVTFSWTPIGTPEQQFQLSLS